LTCSTHFAGFLPVARQRRVWANFLKCTTTV